MVDHIYTFDDPPSERDLRKVIHVLHNDGVIAYPTDINWAFGCNALNVKAIDKMRYIKPLRSKFQPFSLLCSSISMASEYVIIDDFAYRILKKIWPGPYTIILPASKKLARQVHDKRKIIGVRIPDSSLLLGLIEKFQKPLLNTSVPPMPDGTSVKFGVEIFKLYINNKYLDLILDLGKEISGLESTVVDFSSGFPSVIRKGAGNVDIFV